jgi:hypothetical protein
LIKIEDDSMAGSVMCWPKDKEYRDRMMSFIHAFKSHEAVMLRVEQDRNFKAEGKDTMSFALNKQMDWSEQFIRKFPFKEKV